MSLMKSIACVMALSAMCGCGSSNPSTAPATGTVTYKGAAVEGASVVYGPASGQAQGGSGKTDASGKFSITTFEQGDGAIPGSYKVTITKNVQKGGMTPEEAHAASSAGKPVVEPKSENELPAKYAKIETSGLTAEVSEGGPNDAKFDLVD